MKTWLRNRRLRREERDEEFVLVALANGAHYFTDMWYRDRYGPAWRLHVALARMEAAGLVQRELSHFDQRVRYHLTDVGWQALGFDTLGRYLHQLNGRVEKLTAELARADEALATMNEGSRAARSMLRHGQMTVARHRVDDDMTAIIAAVVEPRPPMGFHGGAR